MNPSEITAPPSLEQLYAMLGEAWAENRMMKVILAQHPEVLATHSAQQPEETALSGVVIAPGEEG